MDNFNLKNPEQINKGAYEEISEKKTSTLGYFLLLLMFVFIIVISQTIFADLGRTVTRPERVAYCVENLARQTDLSNFNYFDSNCRFTKIDTDFALDKLFNELKPGMNELASLNSQISGLNSQISSGQRQIGDLDRRYDLGLQEKMAGEQAIVDRTGVKSQIVATQAGIDQAIAQKQVLEQQRAVKVAALNLSVRNLRDQYAKASEAYEDQAASYNWKVFLLKLIFVLPFFLIAIYFYFRLKKKNSPYTLIWTAIAAASSLLFLQVVMMFLYEVLPWGWLTRIFRILLDMPFMRYFVYYGSVLLVILIFGGLVYYIQKKVFDPVKVAIRRIKDNKCPNCSFILDHDHNFCPSCGQVLKDKCSACGGMKIHYLDHCPSCGVEAKNS